MTSLRGARTARMARMTGGRAALGVALLVLLLVPFSVSAFRVFQLNQAVIYAIALAGLVVLMGRTGQTSLAHSAFFAVGAYTTASLMANAGWHFLPALVAAAVLAGVVGAVAGLPALRVSGLYLVLVTLALAVAAPIVIKRMDTFTGGASGLEIGRAAAPEWSGLADDQWSYLVCLVVAVFLFWTARNVLEGRPGRALIAVRDRELAAVSLGINPGMVKVQAFGLSAVYAGVSGGLYAYTVGFISPGSITVFFAISLLTGVVIGGVHSLVGAAIGAAFIQYVPVLTADVSDALGGLVYGATLIVVMLTVPGGLVDVAAMVSRRIRAMRPSTDSPPSLPADSANLLEVPSHSKGRS